jgi:large subunit ribosomal protein L14e
MIEVGRICLKTAGREAGKYCVVLKKMDEKFVLITGPKAATSVKRRRCNIEHLEPLTEKIKIASEASDSDVLKAYAHEGIYTKLAIERPDHAKTEAMKKEKAGKKEKSKSRPEKKERAKPAKEKPKPKAAKHEKRAEPKKEEKKKPAAKKEKPKTKKK